jgi:hypothetical protein
VSVSPSERRFRITCTHHSADSSKEAVVGFAAARDVSNSPPSTSTGCGVHLLDYGPDLGFPLLRNSAQDRHKPPGISVEDRLPCPNCGSFERTVGIMLEGKAQIRSSLRLRARSGRGRWFLDHFNGADFWQKRGRWMNKVRRIDQRADEYHEVVRGRILARWFTRPTNDLAITAGMVWRSVATATPDRRWASHC